MRSLSRRDCSVRPIVWDHLSDLGLFQIPNSAWVILLHSNSKFHCTKKYLFSKCYQICKKLRIWQHLLALARLFPSDTSTIVPKWHWQDSSQVTLARLLPSDTGTIILKWRWDGCYQVTLAIIQSDNYPQVGQAQLFPSGFGLFNLYFVS